WVFGQILNSIGYPSIPAACPATWQEAIDTLGSPPFLLKPRRGNGSRGIFKVEDSADFDYAVSKVRAPWFLQRIVGSDDQEYTIGVFGLGGGRYTGTSLFRRR